MSHRILSWWSLSLCVAALHFSAPAAAQPADEAVLAAQRQALQPLAFMDGTWRGTVTIDLPEGKHLELVQTERIGSLLGGTVKVIEGRSYGPDGSSRFNALAVLSYLPRTRSYNFRAYAQGHEGDFPFELLPDGFRWTMSFGSTVIRHTATIRDDTWVEIGERIEGNNPPVRTDELRLRRVGGSDWPAAGAVPIK